MSQPAITARHVGKTFQLGDRLVHNTLRDQIGAACRTLLRPWHGRAGAASPRADTAFQALDDISFDILPGETVGIIGRNGAGKSTLLKILSQISEPTTGEIRVRGRLAALLEVGAGFHPELTGRENVYLNGSILGMSRVEIRRKFDEIVAFAEVEKFLDTPVKRYSSGMYVRLAFAVAAHLEANIMVVDEVLAVGDAAFQAKCLKKMGDITSSEGRTILFVSHNLAAVEQLCSRGFYLEGGRLVLDGPVTKVLDAYQRSFERPQTGETSIDVPEGQARFLRWELEGTALGEPHTCQTRETCTFLVTLKSRLTVKDAGMSFLLWDLEGRLVVSGHLWEKGAAPIDLEPGLHEFRVTVRLPIKPGLYQVDVRFYSRHLPEIECTVLQPKLNVLPLNSETPPRWQGFLTETLDFQVHSLGNSDFRMKNLIRRIPRPIKRVVRGCYERLRPCFVTDTDQFLKKIGGLIHVGANIGQEREIYAALGLKVLWIEPIPETFAQLQENIRGFAHQEAVQGLVTDRDDSEYEFFVSDNGGESSSILPMEHHAEMWPEVSIVGSIMKRSVTLPTLLRREKMDLAPYQALVLDTQGSELLVLKGAEEIIEQFRFIKIEVPDFQSYRGCVVDSELSAYMNAHGFREMARERFGHVQGVGSYWDVVFCRKGRWFR